MNSKNIYEETKSQVNSGFRLEIFNFIIVAIAAIVTVTLSIIVYRAHTTYDAFYDATEEYINCRTAAEQIHIASEYLTNEVRTFTYTGNLIHVENYFNEANVLKNREKAIQVIKNYVTDSDKHIYLENAVNFSKQLMDTEYYAMRLVFEAYKYSKDKYPAEIKNIILKSSDKELSKYQKISLAQSIVQDDTYSDYKEKIYKNVSLYTEDLLEGTRNREHENSNLFSKYQLIQMILIIILIGTLIINVTFTSIFLIRPLMKNSRLIIRQNSMPVKGSHEMQTFAVLYNKALEKTKTQQEKLSYNASHDSLTGIQNRSVFDKMYRSIHKTDNTTLIIVDIDSFKEINDTYGHVVGDKVLKKVASLLRSSFRSNDIICRIGGDEFTVILNGIDHNYKEQLQNKIEFIMQKLNVKENDLPIITVSMGIAFGSSKYSFKSLYKYADEALYEVKSTTKNGLKFYEN